GAVYVFERNYPTSNNWGQVKELTASDAGNFDNFGVSVSISGDTIVAGAQGHSNKSAIYIFERNYPATGSWGQIQEKVSSDIAAGDSFGLAVAISGDRIIATSPKHSSNQGAAYVFARNQGGTNHWDEVKKIEASDKGTGQYFGEAVSIDG